MPSFFLFSCFNYKLHGLLSLGSIVDQQYLHIASRSITGISLIIPKHYRTNARKSTDILLNHVKNNTFFILNTFYSIRQRKPARHGTPCTCLHAVSARYKYVAGRREWGKVGLPQQLNKQNKNLLRQMNLQTPFIVGTESVMDVSYL